MGKHNNYPGIDSRISRIVAKEAEKVAWRLGFTESFIQDVEQDLHITVSSALPGLQEAIFEKAIQQIVKNKATDIIRWHRRDCRTNRSEAYSMNAPCPESDDPEDEMSQTVDLEARRRADCGLSPSWHERRAESADISDAFAKLPDDLRQLADALDASQGNLIEAARLFGLSHKKARIMRERLQRSLKWLLDEDY
jgi:DNA-directed RNA polymerase specialized sigma24 family protein